MGGSVASRILTVKTFRVIEPCVVCLYVCVVVRSLLRVCVLRPCLVYLQQSHLAPLGREAIYVIPTKIIARRSPASPDLPSD